MIAILHSTVSHTNQEMTWFGQKYLPETPNLGVFSSINVIPFSQHSLMLAGSAFREKGHRTNGSSPIPPVRWAHYA